MNEYRTKDFYISAALQTCGLKLVSLDRNDPQRVEFVFEDPNDEAHRIVNDYWDGKLQLDAFQFVSSVKLIKSRLYSQR